MDFTPRVNVEETSTGNISQLESQTPTETVSASVTPETVNIAATAPVVPNQVKNPVTNLYEDVKPKSAPMVGEFGMDDKAKAVTDLGYELKPGYQKGDGTFKDIQNAFFRNEDGTI